MKKKHFSRLTEIRHEFEEEFFFLCRITCERVRAQVIYTQGS